MNKPKVKYINKITAVRIIKEIEGKEAPFNWILIQVLVAMIFALLHIADVIGEK